VKIEAYFYLGVTAFFVAIGTTYWFTSYEDAGSVMLAASAVLGLMVGGFLFHQSRRMDPRPEDRSDATIADGAGPVDSFPGPTIWPFVLGFGATMLATGTVFGVWVLLPGGLIFAYAILELVRAARASETPVTGEPVIPTRQPETGASTPGSGGSSST
jgi:hypothetical protein